MQQHIYNTRLQPPPLPLSPTHTPTSLPQHLPRSLFSPQQTMTATTRTWAWGAAFLVLAGVVWAAPSDTLQQEDLEIVEESAAGERDEKFFVAIVKISPDQCTTNDATRTLGTCLPSTDCSSTGGVSSGSCAKSFGTCCIAQRTCSQSTSYNNTYFVNPGYTGSDTGTGACMLTVNRVNNNICQVRLDFLDLELEQPDADGNCNVDFLTVTGGTSTILARSPTRITESASKWRTDTAASSGRGTRRLEITASLSTGTFLRPIPRLSARRRRAPRGACTTDYVIIPAASTTTRTRVDRFCGLGFPDSVTSTMKPFVMYVHTNADETGDVANRGFNLQYRQITDC
ncbi:hypothetical protein C7M84_001382 [Penaeus vannamei]|uniref:CUB domain-containing protein n=1 Tax=Penaeus vannamei TaxID=6689 RepID=A0A423TTW1_PENVA|nr:hypothetical protein C7M84_001382 [Penaeus vannamei]